MQMLLLMYSVLLQRAMGFKEADFGYAHIIGELLEIETEKWSIFCSLKRKILIGGYSEPRHGNADL